MKSWPWFIGLCRGIQRLSNIARHLWRKVFSYERKKLCYWKAMHAWSIVRLRRRVILAMVALGLIVALVVTWRTTTIFSGVVHVQLPKADPEAWM